MKKQLLRAVARAVLVRTNYLVCLCQTALSLEDSDQTQGSKNSHGQNAFYPNHTSFGAPALSRACTSGRHSSKMQSSREVSLQLPQCQFMSLWAWEAGRCKDWTMISLAFSVQSSGGERYRQHCVPRYQSAN